MRLRDLGVGGGLALLFCACGGTTTTPPPSNGLAGKPGDGDLKIPAADEDLSGPGKDLAPVRRKRAAAVTPQRRRPQDDAEQVASSNGPVGTQGDGGSNAPPAVKGSAEQGQNAALARGKRVQVVSPQGQSFQVAAEHDPWADAVVSYKPGKPSPVGNKDPSEAIGKPDGEGPEGHGKSVALGHGGELVLEFQDNILVDGPQDDLVVFEIGNAVEPTAIAISEDGNLWIDVGQTRGGKSSVDIGPYVKPGQRFFFVKITDAKAGRSNGSKWPGADIEAVGALNSLPAR